MKLRLRQGDPRTRILLVAFATAIIASTPQGDLRPFCAYFTICAALIVTHRVCLSYVARRCLTVSPFLLLAAGMLLVQAGFNSEAFRVRVPVALSVICKGYATVLLLACLTGSTPLTQLLRGLRQLGSPESLNVILGMMYRYTSLLSEEYSRMERARECRTLRPLGPRRFAVYGRQLGSLILRSWDRAERIHAAMISRGFDGSWPETSRFSLRLMDFAYLLVGGAAFLTVRILF